MEHYFATMVEDVRCERPLVFLLSLTDPEILKKANLRIMK